jgi:hypothetical protein
MVPLRRPIFNRYASMLGAQDPASAHLDPRQSANTQISLVVVSVAAVPARSLQTQPLPVRRASDIVLSKAVAQEWYSRKALCFRHPIRKSLSFECCRVSTGSPLMSGKQASMMGYWFSRPYSA